MLEIKTTYHSGILNIELMGALDSLTSPDFKHWLTEKTNAGYHYFALNCAGLEFISSRGISILIELNNILNEKEIRLILYQIRNEVLNLLEFLKLKNTIPMAENYNQVLEKFSVSGKKISPVPRVTAPAPVVQAVEKTSAMVDEIQSREKTDSVPDVSEDHNLDSHINQEPMQLKPDDESAGLSGEEYIDLNKVDWKDHGKDLGEYNIIFCPNCGEQLKVSKKGLYLCPDCRCKFNYPFQ